MVLPGLFMFCGPLYRYKMIFLLYKRDLICVSEVVYVLFVYSNLLFQGINLYLLR